MTSMSDVYSEIVRIKRAIKEVQIEHSLNKISTKEAKQKIRALTEELQTALQKLPPDQRELYLFEKEYGVGV